MILQYTNSVISGLWIENHINLVSLYTRTWYLPILPLPIKLVFSDVR